MSGTIKTDKDARRIRENRVTEITFLREEKRHFGEEMKK
jgi:hypothetical protein